MHGTRYYPRINYIGLEVGNMLVECLWPAGLVVMK